VSVAHILASHVHECALLLTARLYTCSIVIWQGNGRWSMQYMLILHNTGPRIPSFRDPAPAPQIFAAACRASSGSPLRCAGKCSNGLPRSRPVPGSSAGVGGPGLFPAQVAFKPGWMMSFLTWAWALALRCRRRQWCEPGGRE
jgi:hypothetical protein